MKLIIFAGGIGTRFWPLARKNAPKQFHPIFGNQTTLEHSYSSIKDYFSVNDIYISTGLSFLEKIRAELPEIPEENFIVEPTVRDTGPAVAYALLKIAEVSPDEPVVIRWQNSHIANPKEFLSALNEADQIFKKGIAKLIYIGVPSRYPHTGVGYIHFGEKIEDLNETISLHEFSGFTEKPDLIKAQEYHSSGEFAWNPGCYITTPRFILSKLAEINPEVFNLIQKIKDSFGLEDEWDRISGYYSELPKKSVDYLIWERMNPTDAKVVLADYGWTYVAAWNLLKEVLEASPNSNVITGNAVDLNSTNTMIHNYEDKKLVATINLKDMIIINTPDVIAVFNKDDSYSIKEMLSKLESENLDQYL